MTPQSTFDMEEMEFTRKLKGLDKKEFYEFRKQFRDFSAFINNHPKKEPAETDALEAWYRYSYIEALHILSKKLHLLKKECEKRETKVQIQERIKQMIKHPEEMLEIEDLEFQEAIHNMESNEIKQFIGHFKRIFSAILNDRAQIIQRNAGPLPVPQSQRDNFKIIKRWDFIEEDIADREMRTIFADESDE